MAAMFRPLPLLLGLCAAGTSLAAPVDFNREVQPILSENCYHCHGPDAKAREAGLRLDRREGALGKTEDGAPIVAPGKPGDSELLTRIFSLDRDEVMPPPKSNRKLTDAQKRLLRRWVEEGAPWAEHWAFVAPKRPAIPTAESFRSRLAELEKRDPAPGGKLRARQAALEQWPKNPIDHFALDRLLAEGLAPSPEAPPEKLCRRLYLDLTGIPPSPAEVDAFVAECSRDQGTNSDFSPATTAVERLVNRLLASPRYGERMVWDWLDAARYADTNGYQGDPARAMWYWRDWAIRAINDDMPFDEFTIEQLAGDLLPEPTKEQLIATGFHRNHMINGEGGRIPEESRVDYVMDRVETTGTVWMGLTLNCCRCHDHKFDPIRQREYYQLSAYFNSIDESGANDDRGYARPVLSMASPTEQQKLDNLRNAEKAANKARDEIKKGLLTAQPAWEMAFAAGAGKQAGPEWQTLKPDDLSSENGATLTRLPGEVKAALAIAAEDRTEEQKKTATDYYLASEPRLIAANKKAEAARAAREKADREAPRTMVMRERLQPRETFILVKGAYDKHADKVEHGTPAVLPPLPAGVPNNRLALARWLVSPEHPLTARVTVNRLWQAFFGRGIVKTTEDFGVQGEKPSHPELLDWLAVEFVSPEAKDAHRWDVKALVRLIATSATYRQSSVVPPGMAERDPENRLLARGPRFRLPSWMLRDQALAVSGLFVEKLGGPPVKVYQHVGV